MDDEIVSELETKEAGPLKAKAAEETKVPDPAPADAAKAIEANIVGLPKNEDSRYE